MMAAPMPMMAPMPAVPAPVLTPAPPPVPSPVTAPAERGPRPEGDGWQWDGSKWWRWLPAPEKARPVSLSWAL